MSGSIQSIVVQKARPEGAEEERRAKTVEFGCADHGLKRGYLLATESAHREEVVLRTIATGRNRFQHPFCVGLEEAHSFLRHKMAWQTLAPAERNSGARRGGNLRSKYPDRRRPGRDFHCVYFVCSTEISIRCAIAIGPDVKSGYGGRRESPTGQNPTRHFE